MDWHTLLIGFLAGLIVGLVIARHALIVAVDSMSEEKTLDRARKLIEEWDA